MLKNWLLNAKVRNFVKSGFFIDFLLKKLILKFIKNLIKFTIMFLEKFVVEFIPKTFSRLIPNASYFKNDTNSKIHKSVGILLYVAFLICLLAIW